MIGLELLIPVTLVALCIIIAVTTSYFTPHMQRGAAVSRVVLAALIMTVIAALPALIARPVAEPSADPSRERGAAHASRPEEPSPVESPDHAAGIYWTLRQQLTIR